MIPVETYHGAGNDFLVVDADASDVPDRVAFARAHCDRATGAGGAWRDGDRTGADGVLFLARPAPARVDMTLVQPDGTTAAMCGNGVRCAVRWWADRTGADSVTVTTGAGDRRAVARSSGVTVGMGRPSAAPGDVPVDASAPLVDRPVGDLTVTAVHTGVPHAVAFVDDVDDVDLAAVAPPVRSHDLFPEGTNVTLAAVAGTSPDGAAAFRQRTYERGVEGETRACGTGAVAVVAAAARRGTVDASGPHRVSPPGDDLLVALPDDGPATLTGPVEREFAVDLEVPEP